MTNLESVDIDLQEVIVLVDEVSMTLYYQGVKLSNNALLFPVTFTWAFNLL